ncbi:MAG: membrane protein insertion efficiency factor YidD [Proteobacteria bacterium]|nr:membrane protein insertion efficiency factor YidD [Pseudomonadota bacterium]
MSKLINFILILPIKMYQIVLSPLIGPSCRFNPTCSQYAIQAITKYGALKGLYLALKRIIRCHPWGESGNDPIP